MASLDSISIDCPACHEPILIPVTAESGPCRDGVLEVHLGLDREAIQGHAQIHRDQLAAARKLGTSPAVIAELPPYLVAAILDEAGE